MDKLLSAIRPGTSFVMVGDPEQLASISAGNVLADIIASPLSAACRKRGFATLDLVAHWPDIVGPAYAETTAPDQLSWPRRPGWP